MTLAHILAVALFGVLNGYVVLGGADFGGGAWDLLASGPRKAEQRALVAHAIGPVWEANHVWLILVVVLLFTGFPAAFARLAVGLHVPFALMLIGIVLRGSAFAFRSYGSERDAVQQRWGRTFAITSLVTPVLLGVAVGAVASGAVNGQWRTDDVFWMVYVTPWLTPFALSVGLFTLACFAFLAAVYLTLEAAPGKLREDFRRRALGAGVAVFTTAVLGLTLSPRAAPLVRQGLVTAWWAAPLHVLTATAAVTAFWALWRRRWRLARVAAVLQVSLILWGWGLAQYPYLVPPDVTIVSAAAPAATLRLLLGALALGAIVLLPSLYYLLRVFKGRSQLTAPRDPSAAPPTTPPHLPR